LPNGFRVDQDRVPVYTRDEQGKAVFRLQLRLESRRQLEAAFVIDAGGVAASENAVHHSTVDPFTPLWSTRMVDVRLFRVNHKFLSHLHLLFLRPDASRI